MIVGMDTRLIEVTAGDRPGWLALAPEGHPVGSAFLRLPPGSPEAELALGVHPGERRRGIGTRLLEAAGTAARTAGREALTCEPVEAGSPGDLFLAARGLRPVLRLTYTRLHLAEADLPEAPVPAGYRLVAWRGVVPDDLAEAFAAARPAMDDMPMDAMTFTPRPWDVERVRRVAQAVADRGDHLDTVAAVQEATGAVVAFTEVVVPADGTGDGQHYGTGVLPSHRGHGLARWLKVEAVRRVRADFPRLSGLLADTADSNVAMRAVNESLGYRPTHRSVIYQRDL
ncbi:GNAT family N-acetyltransferase [Nocardioides guangzhouensis]|uniref:GNAT family N-acetyltransferase n=2 Tax=Nocardioides guangzhouensis TaxID=2497878 RepID=A0A4Q4Z8C3_9ACTN|nr:GNAT family N-acetyltransferase [Nocardioides guangzhouensis]